MTLITTGDEPILRIADSNPRRELLEAVSDVDCTVVEVGSTGLPAIEPLVAVTREGQTAFHACCSTERMDDIAADVMDEHSLTDIADNADAAAVVEHEPGTTDVPVPGSGSGSGSVPSGSELSGLMAGVRRVLGGCGWRRPTHPDDHAAAGGFCAVEPEAVVDIAERLRGRGWGDWSHDERLIGTWKAAMGMEGDAAVVVNAHGTSADALLLSSVPFEVLEGANAAARTVDADRVVVYTDDPAPTVREAAQNYPDPHVPIDVVEGPSDYRAAEPTMAIEAIEGNHRLEARLRPPGPDEVGLHEKPTLVHTARTFAHLAVALRDGFMESRLVTVTGDVVAPLTVELSQTDTLETALETADIEGVFKAACVGGRFGGVTTSLDVAPDPDALSDAGLGTEGTVHVLADDRCIVEFVGKRARFADSENCGRCVPCREGTTQLANKLREIYSKNYDSDGIEELARVMKTSSICEFGRRAGRPTRTALSEFGSEFEAHADGRCPAGCCFDRSVALP